MALCDASHIPLAIMQPTWPLPDAVAALTAAALILGTTAAFAEVTPLDRAIDQGETQVTTGATEYMSTQGSIASPAQNWSADDQIKETVFESGMTEPGQYGVNGGER